MAARPCLRAASRKDLPDPLTQAFTWDRTGRERYPPDYRMAFRLDSPAARRKTALNSWLVDHHLLRALWHARERLSDEMWRANQPGPRELRWAKAQGVRTIVNLRGFRDCGSYVREADACARLGLTLVDFPIRSRGAPHAHVVLGAARMFEEIAYPALMHCKSGADRVGFMSVLYLHLRKRTPVREAMAQLSWRRLHFKSSRTGVLDYFFERYLAETADAPAPLTEWVRTRYDEEALGRSFTPAPLMGFVVDRLLRRE